MRDILVVDDDDSTIAVLHTFLTNVGYVVRVARNGAAALVAVGNARPVLILLDVCMPIVDGTQVARKLRGLDASLPIVLMSVEATPARTLVEAGQADAFVAKPFDLDVLLACVERFVLKTEER
jgi:CheY-like chemotaxis protein